MACPEPARRCFAGLCRWQRRMLSITQGKSYGHQQTQVEVRKACHQAISIHSIL